MNRPNLNPHPVRHPLNIAAQHGVPVRPIHHPLPHTEIVRVHGHPHHVATHITPQQPTLIVSRAPVNVPPNVATTVQTFTLDRNGFTTSVTTTTSNVRQGF